MKYRYLMSFLLCIVFFWTACESRGELVHRYSFTNGDTTAVDSFGGQDGTLENGAVIADNALQLDGSSQYVNLPGGLIADFNSLTIEAWFKYSANGNWVRLFDFGNSTGSSGSDYLFFSPQSGGGDTRFVIAGQSEQVLSIATLSTDVPLCVACVYNNGDSTMSIYVNGSLANSRSVSIPLSTVNDTFRYLGRSLWSDPYLKGSIDEFRIYDHALDSEAISYNYNAGPDLLDYEHTATNPIPEKSAVSVNSASELRWSAPVEIPNSYTVYISEFSDLSASQVIHVMSETKCNPDLGSETTYYWRVDTNYGETTYTGIVWNFTTCRTAFENLPHGDWNGDYEVSLADFMMLAEAWLVDADLLTYAELSENWLTKEPSLIINEFMADNDEYLADPDGLTEEYDDWIEIYNRSSTARDLGGMYLTDDLDIPAKWMIPEGVTVGPYHYILFWADGQPEQGRTHTNFNLGTDGEEIGLFDPDGVTLIDSVDFGQQVRNMSYGRYPDNASVWNLCAVPTPEACNCQGYDGIIEDVKFSADGTLISDPNQVFDVYLTCSTPDTVIRYTTDFTDPTETSPEYTGPIHIDSTTCLRAKAFKPGWYSSGTVSRTYVFLDDVLTQSTSPAGFPTSWGANIVDYEVDPDVVNNPAYSTTFKEDLRTIPSVCIVIPNEDFFGAASGIYANATQRGDAWERMASIEVIDPNTGNYYQANTGLSAHGGVGRSASVAKHSLRMIFRDMYGPSKMEFPLFEDSNVESFDQLVLRATWNYSWFGDSTAVGGLGFDHAQYMRELYGHDTIRDMGGLQGYGRHVHLYVNGLYWGLYILTERPDDSFAAEHMGGHKSDYDVIKTDATYFSGPQVIELVAGDRQAWDQLYALAAEDLSDPNNYAAVQGYVDIPALIDYMLMVFHNGSRDAPTLIGTVNVPRNFYAIRERQPGAGYIFLPWDVEWSLEESGTDRVNLAYESGYENPAYLFNRLKANSEFRMLVADHVHKYYFNNGALTKENTIARYWNRSMDIDRAIIGESARWGDSRRSTPYTRDIEWATERNRLINTYFPQRYDAVLSHLRTGGLYPNVEAPIFYINGSYQHGGYITSSDLFSMIADSGTIWYTTDGSDPRLPAATQSTEIILARETADKRVLVPAEDIGSNWKTDPVFDDSEWELCTGGPGGVGYEDSSGYQNLISLDMKDEMFGAGKNNSCYIRIPFTVTVQDLAELDYMTLKIRYDDGYVAYLNGIEVNRINFSGTPEWNSHASTRNGDAATVGWDLNIDVTAYLDNLQAGDNVLAIQAMNASNTSTDFLICAELVAGTDAAGGDVSPTAIEYTGPFTLSKSTSIKTRVLDGSTWSALNEATYAVGPVAENLRITEIMYNPADPNTEFIELQNIGASAINLNLVRFTKGIEYTFGDVNVSAGGYALLVRNASVFNSYYTGVPASVPVIQWDPGYSLDNDQDKVKFNDSLGQTIQEFTYKDSWYELTDGPGFSLTIRDPLQDLLLWDAKDGWRASLYAGGTPGETAETVLSPGSVVINEILSHSHAFNTDWIELYNTTDQDINIGGWFLSDSNKDDPNLMKYEIPANTVIRANGSTGHTDYVVFVENVTFGNPAAPGTHTAFGLNEAGDTVYLTSGDNGQITGFYQTEENVDASESEVTFGRYEKIQLSGGYDFTRMAQPTQGVANTGPLIPDIVITEIHYSPLEGGTYEFIELYNRNGSSVQLWSEASRYTSPTESVTENIPWRLEGIGYQFPADTTLGAGEYLIVAKDPSVSVYNGSPNVYGPYDGALDNGGEQIELQIPGDWEYGELSRYWIPIEKIDYDDTSPWPTSPDGNGDSLHRINVTTYGRDYSNWLAATPTPGAS